MTTANPGVIQKGSAPSCMRREREKGDGLKALKVQWEKEESKDGKENRIHLGENRIHLEEKDGRANKDSRERAKGDQYFMATAKDVENQATPSKIAQSMVKDSKEPAGIVITKGTEETNAHSRQEEQAKEEERPME